MSCPRYSNSGRSKGFAFVEFETSEEAARALEANGVQPGPEHKSQHVQNLEKDPSELQSIVAFNKVIAFIEMVLRPYRCPRHC